MNKQLKPKRYHQPSKKGCAWCKHSETSSPYQICCKKYPEFNEVDFMGWCDEFEHQEEKWKR